MDRLQKSSRKIIAVIFFLFIFLSKIAVVQISATDYDQCRGIANPDCGTCKTSDGIWTALGCIHFEPTAFIIDFMSIALGMAGGIALLLMIYGSFLLSVSTGDPKKAQEGKEVITGTIAGLLFIIFSVFLLNLIGVQIFKIPGF